MLLKLNEFTTQNVDITNPVSFGILHTYIQETEIFTVLICIKISNKVHTINSFSIDLKQVINFNNSKTNDFTDKLVTDQKTEFNTFNVNNQEPLNEFKPFKDIKKEKAELLLDICKACSRHLSELYFNEIKDGKQIFNCPVYVNEFIMKRGKLNEQDKKFIIDSFYFSEKLQKEIEFNYLNDITTF